MAGDRLVERAGEAVVHRLGDRRTRLGMAIRGGCRVGGVRIPRADVELPCQHSKLDELAEGHAVDSPGRGDDRLVRGIGDETTSLRVPDTGLQRRQEGDTEWRFQDRIDESVAHGHDTTVGTGTNAGRRDLPQQVKALFRAPSGAYAAHSGHTVRRSPWRPAVTPRSAASFGR